MNNRKPRSGARPKKPRNPLVALTKRRGKTIEASAKAYRRRPKHTKPPHRDGGFDVLGPWAPVSAGADHSARAITLT